MVPNIPNPAQDGFSILTAAIRNKLAQAQTGFSTVPLQTYEQLRTKELNDYLYPVDMGLPDWRQGAPPDANLKDGMFASKPTINSPSDSISSDLAIYDLVTFEKIPIQFCPKELDYIPESNFATIASTGRNNPFYHFTGAEDTLKFELDWCSYSNQDDDRTGVLANCKKLEALSKNDGYNGPPHKIKLIWTGSTAPDAQGMPSQVSMFSNATWLVVSAPYKISQFQKHRNMFGQQAYQQVILKKVTPSNMSSSQIRDITT